ncbi:DUF1579 family protein [Flagellimonas meishanensis]|uniref:DUF1579 family protein n=1 Tax=Flagellimonas meishanensis TaxID=2873264 RepID=UPI001CA6551C|nr:DUF1579 family protein [[Muricauda] meishanensis]
MRLVSSILLFVWLFTTISYGQEVNLQSLKGFVGSWEHVSKEFRTDGSTNIETGTMSADWVLGNTYIKIDCTLNGEGYVRYYSQFIGYDSGSKKFQSTYLYSGTLQKVFESGHFDPALDQLHLAGVNPFSNQLENGINIRSLFTIEENKIVLELMELRASGEWELGYSAVFTRK